MAEGLDKSGLGMQFAAFSATGNESHPAAGVNSIAARPSSFTDNAASGMLPISARGSTQRDAVSGAGAVPASRAIGDAGSRQEVFSPGAPLGGGENQALIVASRGSRDEPAQDSAGQPLPAGQGDEPDIELIDGHSGVLFSAHVGQPHVSRTASRRKGSGEERHDPGTESRDSGRRDDDAPPTHLERKKGILASVTLERGTDINDVVQALRNGFYADHLGYTPPLIYDTQPNKYVLEAIDSGIVTPEQIPAMFFHRELISYPGSVTNFRAEVVDDDVRSVPRQARDNLQLNSVTTIHVSADLIHDDTVQGRMIQGYTFFQVDPEANIGVKKFNRTFYSNETLQQMTPLRYVAFRVDPDSWRPIIYRTTIAEEDRVADSILNARHEESRNLRRRPIQGGLPGKGKNQ